MSKIKILNLYSGLGGNVKKWPENNITSVELNKKIGEAYKNNFPNHNLIIGDANEYLLNNIDYYDFIWSSPPCQSHSKMVKFTRHKIRKYPDMTLYQQIIFLQNFSKGNWVVENVVPYYEPLIKPTAKIGRHLFWASFPISEDFKEPIIKNFINIDSSKGAEQLKEWLGIYYTGNIYYEGNHSPCQVLRNCVHPDLGLHVFNEYLKHINKETNVKQQTLF